MEFDKIQIHCKDVIKLLRKKWYTCVPTVFLSLDYGEKPVGMVENLDESMSYAERQEEYPLNRSDGHTYKEKLERIVKLIERYYQLLV